MVSATPSGGWLQSSPTIPELGFCLGSRMQMFWLEEGLPSSLAPGPPAAHDADPDPRATATASRCSPAARPAATSRTSGSCCSCCGTSSAGSTCRRRSTPRSWHTTSFPGSFYPRDIEPGVLVVEDRVGDDVVDDAGARAATTCGCPGAWTPRPDVRGQPRPRDRGARRRGQPARDAGLCHRALTGPSAGRQRARQRRCARRRRRVLGRSRSRRRPRRHVGAGGRLGRVGVAGLDGVDQADVLDPGVRRPVRGTDAEDPVHVQVERGWRSPTASGCR